MKIPLFSDMKVNIKGLTKQELALFMKKHNQKTFRAGQVMQWIYKKLATSFDDMTDISKDLREELKSLSFISSLNLIETENSTDGSKKFLFQLEDGETVESVLIPNNRGKGRFTLCISSQVGCAAGCVFCTTGSLGLRRNLKSYEIIDQVLSVKRYMQTLSAPTDPSVTNIVFMGMGEPLNNFDEVSQALSILTEQAGYSKRRITVSTSGIIPGIEKLAASASGVNLAISLNATTDDVRNTLMPVNKNYPLKKLMKTCREFPLAPNRRITFEYVLFDGINDSEEDAHRLIKLLKGIRSKVNLIPYNTSLNYLSLKLSTQSNILQFQDLLRKAGMTVTIRKSMGSDITAACGQLKAQYLKKGEVQVSPHCQGDQISKCLESD